NQPPIAVVSSPATMSRAFHAGTWANAGLKRMSRKMPAFTTAAACRYALTGVAAAIASGSHEWNGNCADFVIADTATSTASVATRNGLACSHAGEVSASEIRVVPVTTM